MASTNDPVRLGGNRICLNGNQRIVVSATDVTPGAPAIREISLYFTLSNSGYKEGAQIWNGFTSETPSETSPVGQTIQFNANVGSYLVRPPGNAILVISEGAIFEGTISVTGDNCNIPQTFWWTRTLEAGDWVPPRFYHRIKVMAGTFAVNGINVNSGLDFAIQQGARYASVGRSIIQVGVDF